MMDISSQICMLKNVRMLENDEQIILFEKLVKEIVNYSEAEHIKMLCSVFDDATENHEVMFGLIHAIESYDSKVGPEKSLEEVSKSIEVMKVNAYEWLMILHKRILNHAPSCLTYKTIIKDSDDKTKELVVELMRDIAKDNPGKFAESSKHFIEAIE